MRIRAILFDLHETLTRFEEHPRDIFRRVSENCGLSLRYTDSERDDALLSASEWLKDFQIEGNVDIHYGDQLEHWLEFYRIMFMKLGLPDVDNTVLMEIEQQFKDALLEQEYFTEDAIETINSLYERGYPMGIISRRYDDPKLLVEKSKLAKYFSTIHWSGVHGYEKPSPFSLIQAAEEIGINPKLCAYVGNDLAVDVVAAQRAQMLPVLLTWANPEETNLTPDGFIIRRSPLELLDIFRGPSIPLKSC